MKDLSICVFDAGRQNASLRLAITRHPAVERQIAERARELFLKSGGQLGQDLEHRLKAEQEAILWIDKALNYAVRAPGVLERKSFGADSEHCKENNANFLCHHHRQGQGD